MPNGTDSEIVAFTPISVKAGYRDSVRPGQNPRREGDAMSITCKNGGVHSHETVDEVRACWIKERVEASNPHANPVERNNLVPQGPRPPGPNAKRNAQRIEAQERQTALYRAGQPHFFTPHCPECIAGTCVNDPTQVRYREKAEFADHERQQEEAAYRAKMDAERSWVAEDEEFASALRDASRNQTVNDRLSDEPTPEYHGRPNRYGGKCSECGGRVKAGEGLLGRQYAPGRWNVNHIPGQCPPPDPARQSADGNPEGYGDPVAHMPDKKYLRDPLPDVPEGHYAITSLTGHNDLDFFRVDRPTEGKHAGRTFIKRVIGGRADQNIRFINYRPVLQAILDAGPEAAGKLYADKIGRCYRCNRHLTDDESRARGMGPDCAQK